VRATSLINPGPVRYTTGHAPRCFRITLTNREDQHNNWTKPRGPVISYDNADELTQTTEPNTQSSTATYAHDPDGNRTSQTGPASLTATYSYDQADRLTRYRSNGQNAANGLLPTTATQTATDVNYPYTGDGLRADLLWDRTQPVPEILADATDLYIYGPTGTPIEQVAPGGTITYYHADQLGSTRALTDKNGRTLGLYDYDPYGNRHVTKATNILAPFGYAGQDTDHTTGLIYMRARWYDPQTGQFLTRDPIGYAGGDQDLYGYVNRNPISFSDPVGLCRPAICVAAGVDAAAIVTCALPLGGPAPCLAALAIDDLGAQQYAILENPCTTVSQKAAAEGVVYMLSAYAGLAYAAGELSDLTGIFGFGFGLGNGLAMLALDGALTASSSA
jgi:RHS repeat-associated protein